MIYFFAAILVLLVAVFLKFRSNYLANLRNYREFLSQDTPLTGDSDEIVAAATQYREHLKGRLVNGLMRMGVEGPIWAHEVKSALNALNEAGWWLQNRPNFNSVDDTVLVQAIAFSEPLPGGIPQMVILERSE